MSPAEVDRRMTVAEVLAEMDLQWFLHDLDVDDPPILVAGVRRG